MTREDLLFKVRHCAPGMGWEFKYPDLFGRYGLTKTGTCEGWLWFEDSNISDYAIQEGHRPLTYATNEELYEMLVIVYEHWCGEYQRWYYQEEEKNK